MAGVQITEALLQAQNPDPNVRAQSEAHLSAFCEQNFPLYCLSLATELADQAKPQDARNLAGLLLKNALDAKEESRKLEYQNRWVACDGQSKSSVRSLLLQTLHSENAVAARTSALAIAKVAAIDLPKGDWPDLISTLLNNMNQASAIVLRQATLETLGYVCEEMAARPEDVLTPEQVNMILTAVVQGMRKEEPSSDVRLAATSALSNAVEFASHNFENEQERNFIMQVVCEGAMAQDTNIRKASFQCLHQIAGSYYNKLPLYIENIYKLTINTMSTDQEDVALQAVEFWSTIAECELEANESEDDQFVNHNFIQQVAGPLTPTLLAQLTKQDEDADYDDSTWNMAMASGTCLGLMARVAGNTMIPLVMPFVTTNIGKKEQPDDWRWREAATFAFGSILEGPDRSALLEISQQALTYLYSALKDQNEHVRDTTAWTVSRMLEFLHATGVQPPLINGQYLRLVVQGLMESLQDKPHVAYHICSAISYLAEGYKDVANGATSPLSPFFNDLVSSLLSAAGSVVHNLEQSKLQVAAFEAINELVRSAAGDTLETVAKLIQLVLEKLHETFQMEVPSGQARDKQAEVQGQLCGVLTVLIQKLSESDATKAAVLQYADMIMSTLLKIFSNRTATVHEEAMLAVGAFTYTCGRQFSKYMPSFAPYLKMGLQNHEEWQVCLSTVGVLGDVCRNIENDISPYCDELISVLMGNLAAENVHRTIKPQILSTFGDIALVIEDDFVKYIDPVKQLLQQAMHLSVQQQQPGLEEDFYDYNNELRNGIFEAYSGIFNGLSRVRCEEHMASEVHLIFMFIGKVAEEGEAVDLNVARSAVNLMGDICCKMGAASARLLEGMKASNQDGPHKMVQWASSHQELQDHVEWAVQQVHACVTL